MEWLSVLAGRFSLKFLNIFVHISGSSELIWTDQRWWCQNWSKGQPSSQLVTGGMGVSGLTQWQNHLCWSHSGLYMPITFQRKWVLKYGFNPVVGCWGCDDDSQNSSWTKICDFPHHLFRHVSTIVQPVLHFRLYLILMLYQMKLLSFLFEDYLSWSSELKVIPEVAKHITLFQTKRLII